MSDNMAGLRKQITGANDLQSVVRIMKSVAASSIGQYERSVLALVDYSRAVNLGLRVCLRNGEAAPLANVSKNQRAEKKIGAIIFGSDQGLVGQFNDVVVDYALKLLPPAGKSMVWAIGERVRARLGDAGFSLTGLYPVPSSAKAIVSLVGQLLVETETRLEKSDISELHLFYNRPTPGSIFMPFHFQLLPLDETWRHTLIDGSWPTKNSPEVLGGNLDSLKAFIREYLFVSLFRASAESLVSENASRLSAMQRADKNIGELLETLNGTFHRQRQSSIDEELFDVLSGFEALTGKGL